MKIELSNPCPVIANLASCGDGTSVCNHCERAVHHVSALDAEEGPALVDRAREEGLCVQFVADRDGRVLFAPVLRAAAAAGLLVYAGVARADGLTNVPDLPELSTTPVEVAEAAEANRVRQALEQIGIDLSSLPTDAPTDGGEPIEFIVVDGGI